MIFSKIIRKLSAYFPSYTRISARVFRKTNKKYTPTRMMFTVLGINLVPLIALLFGLSLIGNHRESLINTELELLYTKNLLYAQTIENSSLLHESFSSATSEKIIKELDETLHITKNTHIMFVTKSGEIIFDTRNTFPKKLKKEDSFIKKTGDYFISSLIKISHTHDHISPYPSVDLNHVESFPGIIEGFRGLRNISVWSGGEDPLIFSSTLPIWDNKDKQEITGVLSITYFPHSLVERLSKFQEHIFSIFASTLTLSIAFSLYLVGAITNPLRKLVNAANSIHSDSNYNKLKIPDLAYRGDEIGELSLALNSMVETLWKRMGVIEAFAADVSHELKNPITSIKSALETLKKVKNKEDKAQLLKILEHDIERLDRLITDISKSTRLDVELSHNAMELIKISPFIDDVIFLYEIQRENHSLNIPIKIIDQTSRNLSIKGNKEKLIQVLTNIIDNALSFSVKGHEISIYIRTLSDTIILTIQDMGEGIPETKLKKIFDRFYSSRPKKEGETYHSGLGLSIVNQIVTAHNGTIEAHNVKNSDGAIMGAAFTLTFPLSTTIN